MLRAAGEELSSGKEITWKQLKPLEAFLIGESPLPHSSAEAGDAQSERQLCLLLFQFGKDWEIKALVWPFKQMLDPTPTPPPPTTGEQAILWTQA